MVDLLLISDLSLKAFDQHSVILLLKRSRIELFKGIGLTVVTGYTVDDTERASASLFSNAILHGVHHFFAMHAARWDAYPHCYWSTSCKAVSACRVLRLQLAEAYEPLEHQLADGALCVHCLGAKLEHLQGDNLRVNAIDGLPWRYRVASQTVNSGHYKGVTLSQVRERNVHLRPHADG